MHFDKKSYKWDISSSSGSLWQAAKRSLLEATEGYWGDFSHLTAQTKGIEEILSRDIRFDHLIFSTGQYYPIKPNSEIQKNLA